MPLRPSIFLAIMLLSGVASAAPTKEECVNAHGNAQTERSAGRLRAARAELLVCASAACPGPVTNECVPWLAEVERATPTAVFEAREPDGSDAVDVTVLVDGEKVTDRLDGRAVPLDPGAHLVRFVTHRAQVERRVVLGEAEKARLVRVDLPAPVLPPPAAKRAATWPIWLFGGVSVASLATFGGFALGGLSGEHDLDRCSPRCPPSRTDPVHRDYVVADVFLGIGIAAAAATSLPCAARTSDR